MESSTITFDKTINNKYTNISQNKNFVQYKKSAKLKNIHKKIINVKKKINNRIKNKIIKKNSTVKMIKKMEPKSSNINTTDVLNEIYNLIDFEVK